MQVLLIKTFYLFMGNKYSAPSLGNDTGGNTGVLFSRLPTDAEMAKRCQPKSLLRSVAIS